MLDRAAFHRFNHLVGHAHHGVSRETDHDGLFRRVFREAFRSEGRVDDRREILVRADVRQSGPSDEPGREDTAFIGFSGLLDAIGSHQDGAGEGVEFLRLILPCPAVVADKVGVLLQLGIGQAWEHFSVGIYV